jgi:DNA-directed RNA polymerase subunit M/transcription elongation factor TFIIS
MTPKQVQRKFASINAKKEALGKELAQLKRSCGHPSMSVKRRSQTDAWDERLVYVSCPDCGFYWSRYNYPQYYTDAEIRDMAVRGRESGES